MVGPGWSGIGAWTSYAPARSENRTVVLCGMPTTAAAPSKSSQFRELLGTGMNSKEIAAKVGCTATLVSVVKHGMKTGKRAPAPRARVAAPTDAAPSLDGLADIVNAVKNAESDRIRMRAALEKIQAVIDDVLAD